MHKTIKTILLFLVLIAVGCIYSNGKAKEKSNIANQILKDSLKYEPADPPYLNTGENWADSVMAGMSLEEKIGQLFMVAAYSKTTTPNSRLMSLIKTGKVGGLIFMQGGPGRQAILTNTYQAQAEVPLMIAQDAEWGLAMRLDSTMRFPWQMTLGAIFDNRLIYNFGAEIARQCRRIGVNINFAPVVDVNVNPKNPVIKARSFGADRKNVSLKGGAYMQGLQDSHVLACAKHFPGHGDTEKDSHLSLPVIKHNRQRLDSIELYPFRQLIRYGVGSIMSAHLYVPALDSTKKRAASLSPKVIKTLLKEQMDFKGLVFTDALNMKGVSAYYDEGEVDLMALLAGNDVLLFSGNVPKAIALIKKAIADGRLSVQSINQKCKKILQAKYWMGLADIAPIKIEDIYKDLHTQKAKLIKRKLIAKAITLLKNKDKFIPLLNLQNKNIVAVSFGAEKKNRFHKRLKSYAPVTTHAYKTNWPDADAFLENNVRKDVVIISLHEGKSSPFKTAHFSEGIKNYVAKINDKKQVILVVFANPYSLKGFKEASNCEGLIVAYQNGPLFQDFAAQILFGGLRSLGRLPVTISQELQYGFGIATPKTIRMQYTIPEDVGIRSENLNDINKIVSTAIADHVFPGCQILAAINGKIFFQKSYGYHTYEKKNPVKNTDLYDIASITKVTATLPIIMQMTETKQFSIYNTFGQYLPELNQTDKGSIKIIKQLTHSSGLKNWIPFHLQTVNWEGEWVDSLIHDHPSKNFQIKVADNVYVRNDLPEIMWNINTHYPRSGIGHYKYSDLGFYYLKKIIENTYKMPLDKVLEQNYLTSLGAYRLLYNPLTRFSLTEIAPTENDKLWRKQTVHGYVHDQGAALIGGVAGHAGLFASANDLAKMFQMYLNGGEYGGTRYLSKATLDKFNSRPYQDRNNRRGIGFDKPSIGGGGNCANAASPVSFGHSGFTGTLAWVDPANGLLYIFLCNRVYPDATNRKLIYQDQRANIQQVFYQAMSKGI